MESHRNELNTRRNHSGHPLPYPMILDADVRFSLSAHKIIRLFTSARNGNGYGGYNEPECNSAHPEKEKRILIHPKALIFYRGSLSMLKPRENRFYVWNHRIYYPLDIRVYD
jgi:hypothetical protein